MINKFLLSCAFILIAIFCNAQADPQGLPNEPIYESGMTDVNPQFPGGEEAMNKFILEAINYPHDEQTKKIGGKVYVQFVVERDGSITNVMVARSVTDAPGLSTEAMRVVKTMPTWIPATQSGNTVRSRVLLPISFVME